MSRFPTWPMLSWIEVTAQCLPHGVQLMQRDYCLKVFCLTRLPLSWSFGQREQELFFFLSVHIDVSWLQASTAPNPGYVRQKENPKNLAPCHSLSPRVPMFFLLSIFQSQPVFFIYNVQCTQCIYFPILSQNQKSSEQLYIDILDTEYILVQIQCQNNYDKQ